MKFNEKILLLRKRAGLSQEELASKLDVSRQTVYKWESESSMPEIPKIKAIAKLFRVSFDYLMDDDIEALEPQEQADAEAAEGARRESRQRSCRAVFCTGINLSYDQPDIDNGYAPMRTIKVKDKGYLEERYAMMRRALQQIGATEIHSLHPDAAIAYFYDANRRVFGFYYAGAVQFVCPIENLYAFRFGEYRRLGTEAWALLSYKDGLAIKEFKLRFSVNTQVALHQFMGDGPDMLRAVWDSMKACLIDDLRVLEIKLDALRTEGWRLVTEEEALPEINPQYYAKENEPFVNEYAEYLGEIKRDAAKAEMRRLIRKAVKWTLIGAAVVLLISLMF